MLTNNYNQHMSTQSLTLTPMARSFTPSTLSSRAVASLLPICLDFPQHTFLRFCLLSSSQWFEAVAQHKKWSLV